MEKYLFSIDRSIHVENKHYDVDIIESCETWLKATTESIIRVLVSRTSIADLISSSATRYLRGVDHSTNGMKSTETEISSTIAEDIASRLHEELERRILSYGISINRVEIQAVRPSMEVQEAINKVWITFLKPVQSEQEAKARQIELEAVARVLGTDVVALNELLKNFQGANFYMIPPFLQTLFGLIDAKSQNLQTRSASPTLSNADEKKLLDGERP